MPRFGHGPGRRRIGLEIDGTILPPPGI